MQFKAFLLLAALAVPSSTERHAPIMRFFEPDEFDVTDSIRRLFGPGRSYGWAVEVSGGGVHEILEVKCTPDSWWRGGSTYSCKLTMDPPGHLKAFKVLEANDVDGDGIVERSEWREVAVASLTECDGKSVAVIPTCHVSRGVDVYRFVREYLDGQPFYNQWTTSDLVYQDP